MLLQGLLEDRRWLSTAQQIRPVTPCCEQASQSTGHRLARQTSPERSFSTDKLQALTLAATLQYDNGTNSTADGTSSR